MAYPRFQRARDFKYTEQTTGNIVLNSVSWANVNTALDITLTAQAGDCIEYGVSFGYTSENVQVFLDVATVVSGSVANTFSKQGPESASSEGITSWRGLGGINSFHGGSVMYVLQAGDISAGTVLLRLRYRTSPASNKSMYGADDYRLQLWAKNLGPKDPN